MALETFEPVVVDLRADGRRRPPPRRAADLTNAFVEGAARILDASEVNAEAHGAAASSPAT